jgi:hypothetical protein
LTHYSKVDPHCTLSKADYDALQRYIERTAEALGLREWTIILDNLEPSSSDYAAQWWPIDLRRRGYIRVCVGFRDLEPEEQRAAIVHELLHAAWNDIHEMMRNDLYDTRAVSGTTYQVFFQAYVRLEETAIDRLAGAVSKFLPLIEWPEKKVDGADDAVL